MTQRQCYLAAAGTTVVVFLLYLATLSPSLALWDAGEYIAAASSLGIPHQPSNPMFVLIAHVAGLLPLSDSYAVRINLLAALSSAVVAGLWFLCAERVLRSMVEDPWRRMATAVASALLGATAFTVWNQSVVMEKVYPLALVGLALISWLVIVWLDVPAGRKADRLLVLVAYLTGLTYAIHPAGLLTGPAAALAVLRQRPGTILRWRLIALFVVAFVVGASSFAMLPLRAAHQPYVNVSAISACEDGAIRAGCTFSAETARRLKGTIEREQYGGNAVLERRGPFVAQLQMFWMYFKWQWIRDLDKVMPTPQSIAAAAMLVLGLAGFVGLRLHRSEPDDDRASPHWPAYAWYFGTLAVTFTIVLVYYLNFRYGWSQSPELGDLVPREPRDRDYFFMWTFSLWGLLAGLGLAFVTQGLRTRVAIATIVCVTAVPLVANYQAASRSDQHFTSAWARDLLASLEPNAVIIAHGDNDSFPLWYAQVVEGVRPDVTVALTPYLGMEWYARQMNRRSHLWNLTDAELDTIPYYVQLQTPASFRHGAIDATIPPGILVRDQLLVLRAIKDTFPNRPIYFSLGPYPQDLGLGDYVKRVGLVQKLEAQPIRETPDTVRLPTGFVDVSRSLALWKTYGGPAQLAREGRWTDAPSENIPLFYALVARDLAEALETRGNRAEADSLIAAGSRILEVMR
jgi:hypothetical protein